MVALATSELLSPPFCVRMRAPRHTDSPTMLRVPVISREISHARDFCAGPADTEVEEELADSAHITWPCTSTTAAAGIDVDGGGEMAAGGALDFAFLRDVPPSWTQEISSSTRTLTRTGAFVVAAAAAAVVVVAWLWPCRDGAGAKAKADPAAAVPRCTSAPAMTFTSSSPGTGPNIPVDPAPAPTPALAGTIGEPKGSVARKRSSTPVMIEGNRERRGGRCSESSFRRCGWNGARVSWGMHHLQKAGNFTQNALFLLDCSHGGAPPILVRSSASEPRSAPAESRALQETATQTERRAAAVWPRLAPVQLQRGEPRGKSQSAGRWRAARPLRYRQRVG